MAPRGNARIPANCYETWTLSEQSNVSGGPAPVLSPSSSRVSEIDRVKGLAMLAVVCIHGGVFKGARFHDYVVDRAVPVFLILFGMSSELWWRSREESTGVHSRWYRGRLARLLPPASAAAAVWWVVAWLTHAMPWAGSGPQFAAALLGYCPRLGTNWFVVIILELVVLFPLLREAASRSLPFALAAAAIASSVSVWHMWDVIGAGMRLLGDQVPLRGFYYQWIFAPRVFWHVVAGIALVGFLGRIGFRTAFVCFALVAMEPLVLAVIHHSPDDAFVGPLRQEIALQFFDVPLAVALLGLCRPRGAPGTEGAPDPLSALGRMSWGVYVGHALVYEIVHVLGYAPETGPRLERAAYTLVLLASGVTLAMVAGSLRNAWLHVKPTPRSQQSTGYG